VGETPHLLQWFRTGHHVDAHVATVMSTAMHPLHAALAAAADGKFPLIDGRVEVHPPEPNGLHVVHEFTGHAVVLTSHDAAELLARGADGFGGVTQPDVVRWLAGSDGAVGSHDALLVARGAGTPSVQLSERSDLDDHPRVRRARHSRSDLRVFGDERGLVTLGHGLVGRLEISVELTSATHGGGAGRELIRAGLGLVPEGSLVWAQVTPGNAASLRAFLACGFAPIGAETLIEPVGSRRVDRGPRSDSDRD
jgi:hypothetical protein